MPKTQEGADLRVVDLDLTVAIDALGAAIAELATSTGEPFEHWRERFTTHRQAIDRLRRQVATGEVQS